MSSPTDFADEAKIQIAKLGRDYRDYDAPQLAKATDGLTRSEIEAVFVEALYQAFDEDQEPTDLTIAKVLTEFVPLSKPMAEQIAGLRDWAKGARAACDHIGGWAETKEAGGIDSTGEPAGCGRLFG